MNSQNNVTKDLQYYIDKCNKLESDNNSLKVLVSKEYKKNIAILCEHQDQKRDMQRQIDEMHEKIKFLYAQLSENSIDESDLDEIHQNSHTGALLEHEALPEFHLDPYEKLTVPKDFDA